MSRMWMKTYTVFSEGRRQDDSEECKTLKEFEIQLDWIHRIREEEEEKALNRRTHRRWQLVSSFLFVRITSDALTGKVARLLYHRRIPPTRWSRGRKWPAGSFFSLSLFQSRFLPHLLSLHWVVGGGRRRENLSRSAQFLPRKKKKKTPRESLVHVI